MYLRTLHTRMQIFSLLGAAAILFLLVMAVYYTVSYLQNFVYVAAPTVPIDFSSIVTAILARGSRLLLPAAAIAVFAELLAWRNEVAIIHERRHQEQLAMQQRHIEALEKSKAI